MRHSICIVLLTLAFNTSAQNNVEYRRCTSGCTSSAMNDGLNTSFTYNNVQSFETQDITSDYSWRDCPGCSTLWHKGADYSSLDHGAGDIDRGDALIVVEHGTIRRIAADDTYKYITVASDSTLFGYGHIFRNEIPNNAPGQYLKSGKFVLKACESPFDDFYAIIDLENCEGIADLTSDTATAKVVLDDLDNSICASDTIMVTNSIQSGEDIAPMGDAATGPVHLHLYRFKNSAETHQSGPGNDQSNYDFFYSDFIPRIHQDDVMGDGTTEIAHCPMNTRYNDGSYEIKAEVNDVPNKCNILKIIC